MTDTQNYCRSDEALGHAARMLLLDVCDPGCGYSDWDIPAALWRELGEQLDAFMESNADDLMIGIGTAVLGTHWIGSRTGAGIGFWSLVSEPGWSAGEREALKRLDAAAKAQGHVSMYAGDDNELYLGK